MPSSFLFITLSYVTIRSNRNSNIIIMSIHGERTNNLRNNQTVNLNTNPTIHLASLNSNITTNSNGNIYNKSSNSNITLFFDNYLMIFNYKYTKYQRVTQILNCLFCGLSPFLCLLNYS